MARRHAEPATIDLRVVPPRLLDRGDAAQMLTERHQFVSRRTDRTAVNMDLVLPGRLSALGYEVPRHQEPPPPGVAALPSLTKSQRRSDRDGLREILLTGGRVPEPAQPSPRIAVRGASSSTRQGDGEFRFAAHLQDAVQAHPRRDGRCTPAPSHRPWYPDLHHLVLFRPAAIPPG